METPETYIHVTRIKNTVMNVRVPIKDKAIVVQIMRARVYKLIVYHY